MRRCPSLPSVFADTPCRLARTSVLPRAVPALLCVYLIRRDRVAADRTHVVSACRQLRTPLEPPRVMSERLVSGEEAALTANRNRRAQPTTFGGFSYGVSSSNVRRLLICGRIRANRRCVLCRSE